MKRRTSIYFDDDFMQAVDDWRRQQPDNPKRNEAIIRMVMETHRLSLTEQHKQHKKKAMKPSGASDA